MPNEKPYWEGRTKKRVRGDGDRQVLETQNTGLSDGGLVKAEMPGKSVLLRNSSVVTATTLLVLVGLAIPDSGLGQVLDSIDVSGGFNGALTYNPRADVVYGRTWAGDRFFTISCSTNRVISTVPVRAPTSIAYDSIDNRVYCGYGVLNGYESLLVVDGARHARIRSIPLPGAAYLQWDDRSNRLYVSRVERDDIVVLDCRTESILCRIPVGVSPGPMVLNPLGRKLYAINLEGGSVSVVDIDANRLIRTIPVMAWPEAGGYCPFADKYYSSDGNDVCVISGQTDSIIKTVSLGTEYGSPAVLSVAASGLVMIAADHFSASLVHVLDPVQDTVVATLNVTRGNPALAWSPVTGYVYCANNSAGRVTVLTGDGSQVVGSFGVSVYPSEMLCVPRHQVLYVAHDGSHMVYVVRDSALGIAEEDDRSVLPGATVRVTPNPCLRDVRVEWRGVVLRGQGARIVSLDGRVVRTLEPTQAGTGTITFHWDGLDAGGRRAPAGVYAAILDRDNSYRCSFVKLE